MAKPSRKWLEMLAREKAAPQKPALDIEERIKSLKHLEADPQPDGSVIQFYESPFENKRRKPLMPSRMVDAAVSVANPEMVPLSKLNRSQSRISDVGLRKYLAPDVDGGAPVVYREKDGTFTIGDGHHRFTAARLRGEEAIPAKIVDVPPDYQMSQGAPVHISTPVETEETPLRRQLRLMAKGVDSRFPGPSTDDALIQKLASAMGVSPEKLQSMIAQIRKRSPSVEQELDAQLDPLNFGGSSTFKGRR